MEKPAAFDLDRALQQWREQLGESSPMNRENLNELEAHLRDSVTRLRTAGLSEQEAWIIAEMRVGQTKTLGEEFEKVQSPARRRRFSERQFIGALLGLFAVATAVLFYFDPPADLMDWMEKVSRPHWFRDQLFERLGLALPTVHDFKIACLAVLAFLGGVTVILLLRDKQSESRASSRIQRPSI